MKPKLYSSFRDHLEEHRFHYLGIEWRERAADAGSVRQMPARAATLDAAVDEVLRQAAHHLLASAVVERCDIRQREAGAAKVTGLLDETGARAGTCGSDGCDRARGATPHDDHVDGLLIL